MLPALTCGRAGRWKNWWRCKSGVSRDARNFGRTEKLNNGGSRRSYLAGMSMDIVFIEALRIDALIGIYDWERRAKQPVVLDLEMAFDNRVPAASDSIEATLDYKAVSKRLIGFVGDSSFGLVETLAERCAEIIMREFGVRWLRLRIAKPGAVRGASAVGVVIERGRRDD